MKYLTLALLVLACIAFVGCGSDDDHTEHSHDAKVPAQVPAAATHPSTTQPGAAINSKCPITGHAVKPGGGTVTFKGQTVGFCCTDCLKPFNANPEKYATALLLK